MGETIIIADDGDGEEEAPVEQVIEQARELGEHDARIDHLEEGLTQCQSELQSLRTLLEASLSQAQQAQATAAEAQQEALQAEAIAIAAMAEEPEETPEQEVTEMEPEPESEEGPASQPSSKWWENLLVIR